MTAHTPTAFEVVISASGKNTIHKIVPVANEQKGRDEMTYWKRRGYASQLWGGGHGQYALLASE